MKYAASLRHSHGVSILEAALFLAVLSPLALGWVQCMENFRQQALLRQTAAHFLKGIEINSALVNVSADKADEWMDSLIAGVAKQLNAEQAEIYLNFVEVEVSANGEVLKLANDLKDCRAWKNCSSTLEGGRELQRQVWEQAQRFGEEPSRSSMDALSGELVSTSERRRLLGVYINKPAVDWFGIGEAFSWGAQYKGVVELR